MKWLLAGVAFWYLFIRKGETASFSIGGSGPQAFRLTLGLNNDGSAVTPGSQLAVQAWPGAYSS